MESGCNDMCVRGRGIATSRVGATGWRLFAPAVLLIGWLWQPAAATCVLSGISVSKVPVIRNSRMVYEMNLVFDKSPQDFWAYYDAKRSSIVVDVYGDSVKGEDKSLPKNLVFKRMTVRNMSSPMSLSGARSQLRIEIDSGWDVSALPVGSDTLRVLVARQLAAQSPPKPSPQRWSAYVFATAVAGLVSLAVLAMVNR
jgi:hypothetical protein